MNKNIFVWLGIIIIVLAGICLAYLKIAGKKIIDNSQNINSFDECVAAGYPIQESYPPVCVADGKSFTQDIGNELEKSDLIVIENPRPNVFIESPLLITGRARGQWFFEASFPIKLYDDNNQLVAQGIVQAQSNWMTDEFVNFKATLKFTSPKTQKGTLVLEKDNPSDLPANDDQLVVPIYFE